MFSQSLTSDSCLQVNHHLSVIMTNCEYNHQENLIAGKIAGFRHRTRFIMRISSVHGFVFAPESGI